MPQRAANRLAQSYHFHQIKLRGAWANRQLQLAAQQFDRLPLSYQHLIQFLVSQKASMAMQQIEDHATAID